MSQSPIANPSKRNRRVRPMAVAGRFYPDNPVELSKQVEGFLSETRSADQASGDTPCKVRAVIAPHAGFVFSGLTAAHAFNQLNCPNGTGPTIKRVVHIGPSHFVPVPGIATHSADAVATPLGEIELDRHALGHALELDFVIEDDQPHSREHGLEVHWPFMQKMIQPGFTLAPFVFGESTGKQCAQLIELLCPDGHNDKDNGDETLLVISSDLSHFHDYDTARQIDEATCQAIEQLRPDQISQNQACGRFAVQGLLIHAAAKGWRVRTLDMRNSGDSIAAGGSKDRVVGYGAWVFTSDG